MLSRTLNLTTLGPRIRLNDPAQTGKKKKANEEAERRRKVIEDKRAAEEQERKRKAEQDRKNIEEIKRLRNEEAERQRNAEAQRDGCSYNAFLNCKLTKFHGDNDPVIVTNWLKEIEDIFEISECSRGQRVKYASHLLKGEARHWWKLVVSLTSRTKYNLEKSQRGTFGIIIKFI
ncbi:hypothetical protein Tco_1356999 [Tanacetum coccineum]